MVADVLTVLRQPHSPPQNARFLIKSTAVTISIDA
jgi:hypothetical protein